MRHDDLRAILAHELAHARNHDLAWNLAAHLRIDPALVPPAAWRIRGARVGVRRGLRCRRRRPARRRGLLQPHPRAAGHPGGAGVCIVAVVIAFNILGERLFEQAQAARR